MMAYFAGSSIYVCSVIVLLELAIGPYMCPAGSIT